MAKGDEYDDDDDDDDDGDDDDDDDGFWVGSSVKRNKNQDNPGLHFSERRGATQVTFVAGETRTDPPVVPP
ncbi:hypothetical protein E4U31_005764 [Claviceps sp. LM219 group G6]|nr:hypothetical protein E4U31_005764 [Claviceps sp. LM219 group G6]